jgi:internalin A
VRGAASASSRWTFERRWATVTPMRSLRHRDMSSFLFLMAGLALGCESSAPQGEKLTPQQPAVTAPAPIALPAVVPSELTRQVDAEQKAEKAEKKPVVCPPAPKVAFSDASLEAEVRRKAGKPEGPLSSADLRKVRSVDLTRGGTKVDELDPCIFPLLTSLHHLYLGGGELTDLSPIKTLTKIEGLRVSMNQVSDLSPIAGMLQMDRLDLGRTQVKDLTPLKGMKNMTELMLDDTPVENLTPLAGLTKLERLSIKRTRVTDLSPLRSLTKLKFLYVAGAPIDNPGVVARPGLKISNED